MTNTNRPSQEKLHVDVAIVGGAMTGAILALALAQLSTHTRNKTNKKGQPLKIALIEAQRPNNGHPGFDARSIAIAHQSIFELTQLGIWPKLAHLGTPITHIHVSDRGHFGMTELNSEHFHLPYLGQVVELDAVGHSLFQLLDNSDVQLFCPATLEHVDTHPDKQSLMLTDGRQIDAALVIAADGIHSKVRQSMNLPLEQVDFKQTAVVANIHTRKPHQHWAYERFTQNGPLALLPLTSHQGQNRLSLVWALSDQEATRLLDAPKSVFIDELQQAFGFRAGEFIDVGQRSSYPLMLSSMRRPIYHRTLFIGNAAQTLHPIAGQGFNLGLRDLVSVIKILKSAIAQEQDLGSAQVVHDYLACRVKDRDSTLEHIEFLVRGFSNQHWPLVLGRDLGLRLLSWFPPLKMPIAKTAMGWKS
ncbi:2-octaprenyl-6-methoxyphenyl hydroxylase [Shewanella surugensis]|uniref:2-octaprenyl-6-methoxyphenyl hydroxylase n=1 Tax=Shewanella surugensis TaxID=212020 RepID=A0ABT0L9G2_9GAMM|nr:2-octaprenyl-6-methoxyphenyl hydroxylase [Shewanella surugensis]MCL1124319.1 2-octaprenyl-6-methoxyphenyl hydroxylase [Shewanella surugensis]